MTQGELAARIAQTLFERLNDGVTPFDVYLVAAWDLIHEGLVKADE